MAQIHILENIAYGEHERHRLDLYIPSVPQSDAGMIFYIHGGGWVTGDKSIHTPDAKYWSERGYICASMNYRYVSETVHARDILDDVTAALETARRVCAEHGHRLQKLLLAGGSAGAHIALLYTLLKKDAAPVVPVADFLCCPPIDCTAPDFLMGVAGEFEDWKYEVLSACCGIRIDKQNFLSPQTQRALSDISPLTYIADLTTPVAICHGRQDELVPFRQAVDFMEILEKQNIPHDLIVYENSGHALDRDPDADLKAKALMQDYLTRVFGA